MRRCSATPAAAPVVCRHRPPAWSRPARRAFSAWHGERWLTVSVARRLRAASAPLMRIISGTAGGIPIAVPRSLLRPTADRVREAVFSILGTRVEGAAVLDLFAGSGSYGLECLSRGARSAVFVESDRGATAVISQNLAKA